MASSSKIAINGGGIAGLSCAIALAQKGIGSTVFEQAESFEHVGAGIQLAPNAMHALKVLGVDDLIHALCVEPSKIRIFSGKSGKLIKALPLTPNMQQQFGASYLTIHRADLHGILLDACLAHNHVEIRQGCSFPADWETDHDALIGADGVRSIVRSNLLDLPPAEFTGKIAWRAMVDVSEVPDRAMLANTTVWFAPRAHGVTYPVENGKRLNLVLITHGIVDNDSPDALREHLAGWRGQFADIARDITEWTYWPLFGLDEAGVLAKGNVALVGDAAHAMLPFAAQGGAAAIEDAVVLAQSLADTESIEHGFNRYEAARRTRVNRIMKTARANGRIYHHSGFMAFARDLVMRAAPASLLSARQNWIYDWNV